MAQENPYRRGLIVKLEGAEATQPPAGSVVIRAGNDTYDVAPYHRAFVDLGMMIEAVVRHPMDPRPLLMMQKFAQQQRPALQHALQSHPAVRQIVNPMVQAMGSYLASSQKLIGMRLRTSHHIARAPKILVPISMSIAAGGTLAQVQVRNPYLGASGGDTSQYKSPWAITSFRTSNGESGALLPIRITQFLLGGHDFVAAALAGLTYAAGGAPATQGWAAGAFAETKRGNWKTEIQPWNVVATHGGGTGFGSVMTETGFLQIGVFNGGTQTYVDTYSVYCNATLCGSPFTTAAYTQVDAFRKAFAPLAFQAPLSFALAGAVERHVTEALPQADYNQLPAGLEPWAWANKIGDVSGNIDRIVNDRGIMDSLVAPEEFLDPAAYGVPLQGDARYTY